MPAVLCRRNGAKRQDTTGDVLALCALAHTTRERLFNLHPSMSTVPMEPAAIAQPSPQQLALSGCWTARGIGGIEHQLESVRVPAKTELVADGSRINALDTGGAWVLQKLLLRLQGEGIKVTVQGLRPQFSKLLEVVAKQVADQTSHPAPVPIKLPGALEAASPRIDRAVIRLRELAAVSNRRSSRR